MSLMSIESMCLWDHNRRGKVLSLKSFVIANGWKSRAFSISKSWNTIGNQAYFLIRHNFEIKEEIGDVQVYTDQRWLVYLLDQLIQNAVKYRGEDPVLRFSAGMEKEDSVLFTVEDNGLGIAREDLPYIFQKGYVGKNHRKGDYRSTGMGLYFVKEIRDLLHLDIRAYSEPGKGSRFELRFQDLSEHLFLSEDTLQKC